MDLTIEPIEEPNEDSSERISDKPNIRQRIESTINKRREVEGRGGYGETTQRGMRTYTTIK